MFEKRYESVSGFLWFLINWLDDHWWMQLLYAILIAVYIAAIFMNPTPLVWMLRVSAAVYFSTYFCQRLRATYNLYRLSRKVTL